MREREYQKSRYWLNKKWAVEYLGGKCVKCGSTEQLEFDHIDRRNKNTEVTALLETRSRSIIEAELKLTQLLCAPCHMLKTAKDFGVEHGGGLSGKKNCKCAPCKSQKNAYMRAYKRRKKLLRN